MFILLIFAVFILYRHTTRFWNYLNQVRSKSKVGKANNLKVLIMVDMTYLLKTYLFKKRSTIQMYQCYLNQYRALQMEGRCG